LYPTKLLLDNPGYPFANAFTFQVGIVRQFARLLLNLALHFVGLTCDLILPPTRPQSTNPVTTGPISWMIDYTMAAGGMDFAPKRNKLLRLSRARTAPMAAPARATSGTDFDPSSSNRLTISRSSKGLVNAARITFQEKLPRSPNQSSERLIVAPVEMEVTSMGE
jgi:hypothetical protein